MTNARFVPLVPVQRLVWSTPIVTSESVLTADAFVIVFFRSYQQLASAVLLSILALIVKVVVINQSQILLFDFLFRFLNVLDLDLQIFLPKLLLEGRLDEFKHFQRVKVDWLKSESARLDHIVAQLVFNKALH